MIVLALGSRPGSYAITDSGSFVLPGDATAFTLPIDDLRFTISFRYEAGGAQTVRVLDSTEKTVNIGLFNFDNSFGITWESEVGTLNGMPLLLALNVVTHTSSRDNSKPRVVTYSFFKRIA